MSERIDLSSLLTRLSATSCEVQSRLVGTGLYMKIDIVSVVGPRNRPSQKHPSLTLQACTSLSKHLTPILSHSRYCFHNYPKLLINMAIGPSSDGRYGGSWQLLFWSTNADGRRFASSFAEREYRDSSSYRDTTRPRYEIARDGLRRRSPSKPRGQSPTKTAG